MTVEMDIPNTTRAGSSLGHPRTPLSAHYPSLLCALWAQFPLPEWIPSTGQDTWHKTIQALTQLWREAGSYGMAVSGPIPWLPEAEWIHHPPINPWQVQTHPDPQDSSTQTVDLDPSSEANPQEIFRWLFTSDPEIASPSADPHPHPQVSVPILPEDPLMQEQFLILITPVFNAVVAQGLHPRTGQQGLMISFEPEVIQRAGQVLLARTQQSRPHALPLWQTTLHGFPLLPPHHRVVARFSSLVLMSDSALLELASTAQLPTASAPDPDLHGDGLSFSPLALPAEIHTSDPTWEQAQTQEMEEDAPWPEAELLQALAHDIRTPLTTILTTVRLALRQKTLAKAQTFLKRIEQECKEQIEKFDLIYQAAEQKPKRLHLGPIALTELIQQNLPQWRSQVERQGSTLELELSEDLTDVMSDSQTLDTILSGMIRQLARNAPPGSQISARLTNAGELVKLQFQVTTADPSQPSPVMKPRQAIGQLLMLQPETGAISLSIPVTRTLFRALGGYLTFKQKAKQGETLTIYLPRRI